MIHNKQKILGEKRRSFRDLNYKWKSDEMEFERIVLAICKYKDIEPIELKKKTRKEHIMNTRQLIYHFSYLSNKITQRYMARFFNQKRENVSHAVWKVEEDSDNYKIFRQQYNEIAKLVNPALVKTHEIGTSRPKLEDSEEAKGIFEKYGQTHHIKKVGGVDVDLRNLKDNESVVWGDGQTFHFLLTEKSNKPIKLEKNLDDYEAVKNQL